MKKTKISILVFIILSIIASFVLFNTNNEYCYYNGNFTSLVYVKNNNIIVIRGIDTFGVTKNEGTYVNNAYIKTNKTIKSLAVGTCEIIFCDENGNVYRIGTRVENGTIKISKQPKKIKNIKHIKKVAAGDTHFLALNNNGEVFAWGSNSFGQVDPAKKSKEIDKPIKINNIKNADDITTGFYSSCAICNGEAFLWGEDNCNIFEKKGVHKLNIKNVEKISIGRKHMLVSSTTGVWGYGNSNFYQLGKKATHIEKEHLIAKKVNEIYCGNDYSCFRINNKLTVFGNVDGIIDENQKETVKSYYISKSDIVVAQPCKLSIFNKYNYDKLQNFTYKKRISKRCDFIIVDTGLIENKTNITGINLCDRNNDIQNNSYNNLHGQIVTNLVINKIGSNKKIEMIKALDGDSGTAIDLITSLYLINIKEPLVANLSIALNDIRYKNIINGLINSNVKYYFAMSNYESDLTLYLDNKNIIYCYDSNITRKEYAKSLKCNSKGIEMPNFNIQFHNIDIPISGNSCATAIISATYLKKILD